MLKRPTEFLLKAGQGDKMLKVFRPGLEISRKLSRILDIAEKDTRSLKVRAQMGEPD